MDRRVTLVVCVDLDQVPGTMHTEESARSVVQTILHERMPHYRPMVYLGSFLQEHPPVTVPE